MIQRLEKSVENGLALCSRWAFALGCVLLAFIVVANAYEVTSRYAFRHSSGFMDEILMYANAGLIYIGLAWNWRRKGHIRLDVLTDKLAQRWPRGITLSTMVLTFVAVLAFTGATWACEISFIKTWYRPDTQLETPWAYPHAIFTIGMSLFCLEVLVSLVRQIRELSRVSPSEETSPGNAVCLGPGGK